MHPLYLFFFPQYTLVYSSLPTSVFTPWWMLSTDNLWFSCQFFFCHWLALSPKQGKVLLYFQLVCLAFTGKASFTCLKGLGQVTSLGSRPYGEAPSNHHPQMYAIPCSSSGQGKSTASTNVRGRSSCAAANLAAEAANKSQEVCGENLLSLELFTIHHWDLDSPCSKCNIKGIIDWRLMTQESTFVYVLCIFLLLYVCLCFEVLILLSSRRHVMQSNCFFFVQWNNANSYGSCIALLDLWQMKDNARKISGSNVFLAC